MWCNRLQPNTGPDGTDDTYYKLGERTKTKPTTGPATTYGYDQAGDLTSVERPKEGETAEIKDTYAYNGEGLRASQTISGTTTYLTWDTAEGLPLVLSDTTNSYIYGLDGLPIEQISSGGTVTYLHHDQQGSTRLLTGSTGTVTGKCTYSAYGTPTCEGATTTPLGFDGQYTSSDTGLIYLRGRTYDPTTAQFLSVDPLVKTTGAPYTYVGDNPLNGGDPAGMCSLSSVESALESINPFSSENCAYQATKETVNLLGGNASTIATVTSIAAIVLAATPAAPLAVALAAVSSAASAYAVGQEAAQGHTFAAALDGLGSVLGGTAAGERVLASLESLVPKLGGDTAAETTKALAGMLDKLGYGALAASILTSQVNVEEGGSGSGGSSSGRSESGEWEQESPCAT